MTVSSSETAEAARPLISVLPTASNGSFASQLSTVSARSKRSEHGSETSVARCIVVGLNQVPFVDGPHAVTSLSRRLAHGSSSSYETGIVLSISTFPLL